MPRNPYNYQNLYYDDFRVGQGRPGEWFLWSRTPTDRRDPDILGEQWEKLFTLPNEVCSGRNAEACTELSNLLVQVMNHGYSSGFDRGESNRAWEIRELLDPEK